ncbi:hypothetical protein AVEN_6356-1 [Araneus ventricosus]|uniref:Uncharacterized protein n=1 Tax=Araneus ventricosus TaxID=182803 RepID=A0A4Y2HV19_ARAVE|nr:hypothetical protein AVEN_6356-1 [Araneus ventricosus]
MKSGRNHYVTDTTPYFLDFKDLHNKFQLTNREGNSSTTKLLSGTALRGLDGRNHHVTYMTPYFLDFKDLHNKFQLTNREGNCSTTKLLSGTTLSGLDGRNHLVTDMTAYFLDFKDLHNKFQLTNREGNVLNEEVAFRDSVKWIIVKEFGSYLYKGFYDLYTPFKKADFRKQIRGEKQLVKIGDFESERTTDTGSKLTE